MRTCYTCGAEAVEMVAIPGRRRSYKRGMMVTWPADLQVATCGKCGAESLTMAACLAIDDAARLQLAEASERSPSIKTPSAKVPAFGLRSDAVGVACALAMVATVPASTSASDQPLAECAHGSPTSSQ